MISLTDVRAAASRIAGAIHHTPLFSSLQLGERVGVRLYLKCESFQKTGSFKARGALNRVLSLSGDERGRGLVTVSAGNHAAAVAWAARVARCSAVVVMPVDAPQSKIDAVRGYGAEIVLHADRPTLFDKLDEVREARGLTFVHPFDDPVLLAGSGTTGLEILEDLPEVDVVVVPVGGGGLLGGVTSAIKGSQPRVRVVAVELEAGPGLGPALAAGKPVPVTRPATLADGMTPPSSAPSPSPSPARRWTTSSPSPRTRSRKECASSSRGPSSTSRPPAPRPPGRSSPARSGSPPESVSSRSSRGGTSTSSRWRDWCRHAIRRGSDPPVAGRRPQASSRLTQDTCESPRTGNIIRLVRRQRGPEVRGGEAMLQREPAFVTMPLKCAGHG